jgi:hypothetical protein
MYRFAPYPPPLADIRVDVESPQEELSQALSDDAYDQWVSDYGIRDRVACPMNLREELREPAVQF